MIKKQYIQPSMKAIKIEPMSMICGSGDGTETVSFSDPIYNDTPESTSQGGFEGIFGD